MNFDDLLSYMYKAKLLSSNLSLMSWDMEVMMPSGSDRSFRSDQSSYFSGLEYEYNTSDKLKQLLSNLKNDTNLAERDQKEVEIIDRDVAKLLKLNKEYIESFSKLTGDAYTIWEKAKKASDFSIFEPSLEKIVEKLKEQSEMLGYEAHPYDALLDKYEEGATVAMLDPLFSDVKSKLGTLIQEVREKQSSNTDILRQSFDIDTQNKLILDIMDWMEMDRAHYRLDISSHPFCSTFHPTDVRMTTRYDENDIANSIWSAIHESGHARYEMGLSTSRQGMPSATNLSMGIHESQSRFWENNIGRSSVFLIHLLPMMKALFPTQFQNTSAEMLFGAVNHVEPSLIRTEADELTYHYHIMIRYEIEKELISGNLKVKDVKNYWNDSYKKYLNIDVPNDAKGVLQDVHWSFGMGYFPTYSLGSFYAAQWYETIKKSLDIDSLIANGDFKPINQWHQHHIHQFGRLKEADDLCRDATGSVLSFDYFEKYIKDKFSL